MGKIILMQKKYNYKKNVIISAAIATLFLVSACTQPSNLAKTSINVHDNKQKGGSHSPSKNNPFYIKVKKNESLSVLAQQNNISLKELIRINELRPPYNIYVGQMLKLPKPTYHIIKEEDTLYSISRSYEIDLESLIQTNEIQKPYTIFPGQKLEMPSSSNRLIKENYDAPIARKSTSSAKESVKSNRVYGIKSDSLSKPNEQNLLARKNAPKPVLKRNQSSSNISKELASRKNIKFNWPIDGKITSAFGPKKGGLYNDGINISAAEGSPIRSAADGKVVYSGNELKGYGNLLLIKHDNGFLTAYAHNQRNIVKKGNTIKKGQVIGYVGSTGHVKSPQLHFSIRRGRKAFDPEKFLSK